MDDQNSNPEKNEQDKPIDQNVPTSELICPWDPSITKEEIDRRVAEGGGMSLAEFWRKMGVE